MPTNLMRRLTTAALLGLVGLLSPAAPAQVKPAVLNDLEEGGVLRHGRRLNLTLKNGKKIRGTLVRATRDSLFVRTAPGQVPVQVGRADVTNLEAAHIRPAGQGKAETEPEIHRIEIIEGGRTTVRYVAPALSPSEMTHLKEIERAENEVARLEALNALGQQVIVGEEAVEASRQRALKNFYDYSSFTSLGFMPATVVNSPEFGAYNAYGVAYAYAPLTAGAVYSVYGPYGAPYAYGYTGLPWVPGMAASLATPPSLAGKDESILKAALLPRILKEASPEALATARADLERAKAGAVFENGRIVAVSLEEKSDYRPGDRVRVVPKKGKAMTGTVVRSDSRHLVLRTQEHAPPTMIRWQNIDLIEPLAVRPAGGPPPK
jgi:small nuclear ribonucleoprotein (snRNP)-like protein